MRDYRLYLFNSRGRIQKAIAMDAENDEAALSAARAEPWQHQRELWQRSRLVALMVPTTSTT